MGRTSSDALVAGNTGSGYRWGGSKAHPILHESGGHSHTLVNFLLFQCQGVMWSLPWQGYIKSEGTGDGKQLTPTYAEGSV